jgi:hypothetical protein
MGPQWIVAILITFSGDGEGGQVADEAGTYAIINNYDW